MDWNTVIANWAAIVGAAGSVATAVGIFFAWWQIRLAKRQAQTQFEDGLAREYRDIAMRLPIKALLDENLFGIEYQQALDELYHYIDLTNEQIFHDNKGASVKKHGIIGAMALDRTYLALHLNEPGKRLSSDLMVVFKNCGDWKSRIIAVTLKDGPGLKRHHRVKSIPNEQTC
ncbi:MAG: hypothetical protein ACJ8CR_02090 [Roseiflexaceae bacterium]